MRCPRSREKSRRSPRPGTFQRETRSQRSGRFSKNHSSRSLNWGTLARVSGSSTSTANSGINPTIEWIRSGIRSPSGSSSWS
ncbi:MAG: hypothetical protein VYB77_00450 [Planctomycetota bacterium]|nr:hypothetical protein [Planctomycetota bacterium]